MKPKKENDLLLNQVHELEDDLAESHEQEVDRIMKETYQSDDMKYKISDYKELKKMKWWTWLAGLAMGMVLTGISVILWYKVGPLPTAYYDFGTIAGVVIIMMMINWAKNRSAAKHFNDRRRRYQRTLSDYEAKIFLTLKTIFLGLLLFLPAVISFAILTPA